jgi:hypothetical protein
MLYHTGMYKEGNIMVRQIRTLPNTFFSGGLCWPGVLNKNPMVWLDHRPLVLLVLPVPENKFNKAPPRQAVEFLLRTLWPEMCLAKS